MDHLLLNATDAKYRDLIKADVKKLLKGVIKDYMAKKDTPNAKTIDCPGELKSIENVLINSVKTSFTDINNEAYLTGITSYSGWKKPEDDD